MKYKYIVASVLLCGLSLGAATETTNESDIVQDESSIRSDQASWPWYIAGGIAVFGSALFGYRLYSKNQKSVPKEREAGQVVPVRPAEDERTPYRTPVRREELYRDLFQRGIFSCGLGAALDVTEAECHSAAFIIRFSLQFIEQGGDLRVIAYEPKSSNRSTIGRIVDYLRAEGYKVAGR